MFPPERTTPTRAPGATGSFPTSTAAAPTAPVGATTIRARSASTRTAATISASVTRLTSVSRSFRIGNVSAPGLVTRIPSAIVGGGAMVTRSPFWSERYVSFAVSASTPITTVPGKRLFATVAQPAPAHRGHEGVERGDVLEELERRRPLARDDRVVVVRRHEHAPGLGRDAPGERRPVVLQPVVEDDLATVVAGRLNLRRRRVGR